MNDKQLDETLKYVMVEPRFLRAMARIIGHGNLPSKMEDPHARRDLQNLFFQMVHQAIETEQDT
jgi:hypothetical protein